MKSFFEKLTGTVDIDEADKSLDNKKSHDGDNDYEENEEKNWMEEEEGELTIDMYQDNDNVIIKTMVAGVKPEDLDVDISRDMVTIRGKREESHEVENQDYFSRELYWGSFSRTITLPTEINIDEAQAEEKHGLLTLILPKTDKGKKAKLKVKSK
ncbi:MAG: Hsp20/alpha crystallin family protein [Candidatus Pacebacteria bacterium]|nr:Hsp20/alpha crystallin family protein [Candidatus Paceibacterota bacterium]